VAGQTQPGIEAEDRVLGRENQRRRAKEALNIETTASTANVRAAARASARRAEGSPTRQWAAQTSMPKLRVALTLCDFVSNSQAPLVLGDFNGSDPF
jgi:hypothetical protein